LDCSAIEERKNKKKKKKKKKEEKKKKKALEPELHSHLQHGRTLQ
jgi:hypothetical protein